MSHRSQVRSVIYGSISIVEEFIKTNQELLDIVHADIGIEFLMNEDEKIIHLHGDYIKWYKDFPSVIAWNKLLKEALEFNLEYEFIELGEGDSCETRCTEDSRSLIGYSRITELNI